MLISIVIEIGRAIWSEYDGYDEEYDDEYVNPNLDVLPLSDKFIQRKERILQVYLIVFGLFVSSFYHPSLHSGNLAFFSIESSIVLFLCSALIYYVLLSRRITELVRRFMDLLACIMGLDFTIMLMMLLGYTDCFDSFSCVLFSIVFILITFFWVFEIEPI